jgi:hypothetical protein
MRASRVGLASRGLTGLLILIAGSAGALVQSASAEDVQAALEKANVYIDVAKNTERAVDSWDRYRSWVNMKTGPTGKERYISYGMYDLYDLEGLLKEARAATGKEPSVQKLDAAMAGYIDAYEALAPSMNRAAAYYDSQGYETDKMAEGKALHETMVPLATAFLAARGAMMPELRSFARDVEQQEIAAIEVAEGRTATWQVRQVMHAANRVVDLFPRQRPQPIDSDTLDEMIKGIGPDTPDETFDQIMAGVVPGKDATIDVARFGEALDNYAKAVEVFEGYSGEKPEDFDEFKPLPGQMLVLFRQMKDPLAASQGREFEGGGPMVMQITETYFSMMNAGSPLAPSRLGYLP